MSHEFMNNDIFTIIVRTFVHTYLHARACRNYLNECEQKHFGVCSYLLTDYEHISTIQILHCDLIYRLSVVSSMLLLVVQDPELSNLQKKKKKTRNGSKCAYKTLLLAEGGSGHETRDRYVDSQREALSQWM